MHPLCLIMMLLSHENDTSREKHENNNELSLKIDVKESEPITGKKRKRSLHGDGDDGKADVVQRAS